jgi:hypothetical protein
VVETSGLLRNFSPTHLVNPSGDKSSTTACRY